MPERDSPGGFPQNGRKSRLYMRVQFRSIKREADSRVSTCNLVATLPLGQECQCTNSSPLYSRCQSVAVESINLVLSYRAKVLQDTEFHHDMQAHLVYPSLNSSRQTSSIKKEDFAQLAAPSSFLSVLWHMIPSLSSSA